MGKIDITVPDIGDVESVEVIEVLVANGDNVAVEDSLITVESDKASMEIPAAASGVIETISVEVGASVKAGDVIGSMIAQDGAGDSPAETSEPVAEVAPAVETAVVEPAETNTPAQPATAQPATAQPATAMTAAILRCYPGTRKPFGQALCTAPRG